MAARLLVSTMLVLALCALQAQRVHAQEKSALADPYFALKLMLGVGGTVSSGSSSVNLNVLGTSVSGNVSTSASDNLKPSFGGGAQYMHPLHRYFALGGLFAVQSWQSRAGSNANSGRNLLLDLSIVPQGKIPLTNAIELYLSLPIGLTLDFLNQASSSASVGGIGASGGADTAVGYNLSLLAGARFALSSSVGLLAEVGYTRHGFSHTFNTQAAGVVIGGVDVDFTLEQIGVNLGVFF